MPRWSLLVLLVVAVGIAGCGVAVLLPHPAVGWVGVTAFTPLPSSAVLTAADPVPAPLGCVLLALGAGSSGALAVALLPRRRRVGGSSA